MQNSNILPDINDLTFAISDTPLGRGSEATVFRVHTRPDYTLRVSNQIRNSEQLINILNSSFLINQKDFYEGRNFAQAVAIFKKDYTTTEQPLLSINKYVPGFSIDINRLSAVKKKENEYDVLTSEEKNMEYENVLSITKKLSETILNLDDSKFDKLFDDLHFLNSIGQSIDCGGGLFFNMGNILYSGNDDCLNIIDLQPFRLEGPGINPNHTKANNTPFNLTQGILPGSYFYRNQDYLEKVGMPVKRGDHTKNKELTEIRTGIVEKVIQAAERNKLSDINSYSITNRQSIYSSWMAQLNNLRVPEKIKENMAFRLVNIKDEIRYPKKQKEFPTYLRVGRELD